MAAWRNGGIPALPFKSTLPAAVAPNRMLSASEADARRNKAENRTIGNKCFSINIKSA